LNVKSLRVSPEAFFLFFYLPSFLKRGWGRLSVERAVPTIAFFVIASEAISFILKKDEIASSLMLLAMTAFDLSSCTVL